MSNMLYPIDKVMTVKTRIVFTDERVPCIEIWNYQSPTFTVVDIGGACGIEYHHIDAFTHHQEKNTDDVTLEFAEKIAKEHFDQMYLEMGDA